ncbi:hypothetical protein EJ08DRAFT_730671 [Tothia fuscella]|uniref:Uncharacterized protein n=1 Tax=Tothia fuscella TaxID=1048955 RepID=A0A9P4NZF8_9PEZI|nr:hypothetical protein EJ08DRAFT_730671 [Tothia fuscella]
MPASHKEMPKYEALLHIRIRIADQSLGIQQQSLLFSFSFNHFQNFPIKMKALTSSLLFGSLWFGIVTATPTQITKREDPTVTAEGLGDVRPFTVKSYQSPYPGGSGLSGLNLVARQGKLLLSNRAVYRTPVISVAGNGLAWLRSTTYTPLYIDPSNGALGYVTKYFPVPAGAISNTFFHTGTNSTVTVSPSPSQGSNITVTPSAGNGTIGADPPNGKFYSNHDPTYPYWYLCSISDSEYEIYGSPGKSGCTSISGIVLAALDASAAGPVGSY